MCCDSWGCKELDMTERTELNSHIAGRFFNDEPPGKPKNTGVSSLSLLQRIFPIQESNWGLLHCRRILYQLSHKGSPRTLECVPILSPADVPNPGIELGSPALQMDSLPTELSGKPQ